MSYATNAATAQRMLAAKGVALPLTKTSVGLRDAVHQSSTPSTPQTQTVFVLILPATVSRDMTLDERAQVRTNQRQLYIAPKQSNGAALLFEPEDGQSITFENRTWELRGVSKLAPDGNVPVLYIAEAKR